MVGQNKTFILDKSRGIKILKNIKNGKKQRVKGKLADGRWKKIRFSPNGHVVSVIQSDSSREEVILSPTLDLNKSHRELILSAPSHKG